MNGSFSGSMNMLLNGGMSMNNIGRMESITSGGSGNIGRMGSINSGASMGSGNSFSNVFDSMQQQQQQQQQMMMGRNNSGQLRNSMSQMPPPPLRTLSNGTSGMNSMGGNNELSMMQQLRLDSTPPSIPSWTPSMNSMDSSLMTMSTGADVPQMTSRR